MDKILALLVDPSWWFTVVFIGMLVSLASTYIKDWLNQLISYAPEKYRAWRNRKIQEDNSFAERIASDSTRLIIANIKVVRLMINNGMILIIFIMIECFIFFFEFNSKLDIASPLIQLSKKQVVLILLSYLFGVISVIFTYKTSQRRRQIILANKIYISKLNGSHISRPASSE